MLRHVAATLFLLASSLPLAAGCRSRSTTDISVLSPMASYRFGLLRRGPAWTPQPTPATDSIQAGHMANIQRMADLGVLLAAGPIGDRGDVRGVFIFRPDSIAGIRELAAADPAIRSGRLVLDLYSWSAPPGIGEPYRRMAQQPGHRDSMVRLQLVLLKDGSNLTKGTDETRSTQAARGGVNFRLAPSEVATAGLFSDGGDLRGVLVLRGDSAQAHARAREHPWVKSGQMTFEMHPWYAAYGTMPGDTLRGAK